MKLFKVYLTKPEDVRLMNNDLSTVDPLPRDENSATTDIATTVPLTETGEDALNVRLPGSDELARRNADNLASIMERSIEVGKSDTNRRRNRRPRKPGGSSQRVSWVDQIREKLQSLMRRS
jgi:hypothetical protein